MEDKEYENAYREALEALYRRRKTIDQPYQGNDGLRYCRIDGLPLTDFGVVKEAWGDLLTAEILNKHEENESQVGCCAGGDRLWEEYCIATRQYLKVFAEHYAAARRHDAMDMY